MHRNSARPSLELLAPDLARVSLPYPSGLVNCYVILGRDGVRLIDSGHATRLASDQLDAHLAELGARRRDVVEILLTHGHHDHVGMAGAISEASGAAVLVHEAELEAGADRVPERVNLDWMRARGLPEEVPDPGLIQPRLGPRVRRLTGAETLEFGPLRLELIVTPGHSPGLLCALERSRGWLFTTDQVLRAATPIALVAPYPGDPVAQHLEGLERLAGLRVELALPGHGRSFSEFERHREAAAAAQREQIAAVAALLAEGVREPVEIARRAGWLGAEGDPLAGQHLVFGVGRAIAYLRHLEGAEPVLRRPEEAGSGSARSAPSRPPYPGPHS